VVLTPAVIQERLVQTGKFNYVGEPKHVDGQWVIRVNQINGSESSAVLFFHVDEHGHPLYRERYVYMGELEQIMGRWQAWVEDRDHRHHFMMLPKKNTSHG
jgi:hypothetical protein